MGWVEEISEEGVPICSTGLIEWWFRAGCEDRAGNRLVFISIFFCGRGGCGRRTNLSTLVLRIVETTIRQLFYLSATLAAVASMLGMEMNNRLTSTTE